MPILGICSPIHLPFLLLECLLERQTSLKTRSPAPKLAGALSGTKPLIIWPSLTSQTPGLFSPSILFQLHHIPVSFPNMPCFLSLPALVTLSPLPRSPFSSPYPWWLILQVSISTSCPPEGFPHTLDWVKCSCSVTSGHFVFLPCM